MKKRRFLSILCSAVLALSAAALPVGGRPLVDTQIEAGAISFIKSGDWVYAVVEENGKKSAMVSGYIGEYTATHLTVPYMIDGLKVTRLNGQVFYWNSNLKELTLPSSLKIIYPSAFWGTPNLEKISLNNNPNFEFKGGVLYARDRDKNNIPGDESDDLERGDYHGCKAKKTVVFCSNKCSKQVEIADGVTTIENYAFINCENLEHVILPNTVTVIGDRAFENCTSLQDITIPYGVKYIGYNAFCKCKSLRKVDFPSTLKYIGQSAFGGCTSLKHVHIPDGVEYIAPNAFSGQYESGDLTIYGSEDNDQARECADESDCNYVTPTTGADGTVSYGDFTHDPDDPYDHCYILSAKVDPTCTAPGGLAGICFCGHTYYQQLPPTGHAYAFQGFTAEGAASYKCTVCGETYSTKPLVTFNVNAIGSKTNAAYKDLAVNVFTKDGAIAADGDVNGTSKATVKDLEAGTYNAQVSAPGYVPRMVEVNAQEGRTADLDVELHKFGDINGDGDIGTSDAVDIKAHLLNVSILSGYELACADATDGGSVDTSDYTEVVAIAKGLIVP